MKRLQALVAGALMLAGVQAGAATLVGDEISITQTLGSNFSVSDPTPTVVSPGQETTLDFINGPRFAIDIEATSISFSYLLSGTFGFGRPDSFLTFSGLDFQGGESIVGASFSSIVNANNLTDADLSFTSDSIRIILDGALFSTGGSFTVQLEPSTIAAVPVPAASLLLLSALGGVLVLKKRRRRS